MKSLLDELKSKYGDDIFEIPLQATSYSTGSFSLDISTGIGGVPRGLVTEIYGPEGTGKTTLALSIAKNVLADNRKILYLDTEGLLSNEYLRSFLGDFDEHSFIVVRPPSAEIAFSIIEDFVDDRGAGLVVLDSLAGLPSEQEISKDFGEATVAVLPRLMASFLRRNRLKLYKNDVAMVICNQVRDRIGSFIAAYESPGGHALKHLASLIISLSRGEKIKRGDEIVGVYARYIIQKNKFSPPFRSFTFPLIFGRGVDFIRDVIEFASFLGVLQKKGSYYIYAGQSIAQGFENVQKLLSEDSALLEKIKSSCSAVFRKDVPAEMDS